MKILNLQPKFHAEFFFQLFLIYTDFWYFRKKFRAELVIEWKNSWNFRRSCGFLEAKWDVISFNAPTENTRQILRLCSVK